jgi:hypothetical protein
MKRGFRFKKPVCLFAVLVFATCLAVNNRARAGEEDVQLLFVQNAKDVTLEKDSLVLKGVAPMTNFFADRPKRMAGHMATGDFVDDWGKGENSFAADPPNAALSIFGEEEVLDVVVTLMNPRLEGENLTYDIVVLEGEVPKTSGPASLFIDPLGRPMTPTSRAGRHRRVRRHEVRRHRVIR